LLLGGLCCISNNGIYCSDPVDGGKQSQVATVGVWEQSSVAVTENVDADHLDGDGGFGC